MNSDSANSEKDIRGPGVPISPVWIALIVFGASCVTSRFFPTPIAGGALVLTYTGYFLMALSGFIAIDGHIRLNSAKTGIAPWKPTTTIVKIGVYRFTRNPLYLSLCMLQLGIGLAIDSATIIAGSLVTALIIYFMAIRKEEPYLESKFGDEYLNYKNKTRRWI